MSGETIDCQCQHADIHQRDGQAAECFRDGLAAPGGGGLPLPAAPPAHSRAAAAAKAKALPQRKALGALHQYSAQHTAVQARQRHDAQQCAAVRQASRQPQHGVLQNTPRQCWQYTPAGAAERTVASSAIRLPAYHAKGVTSTCVMHSCIPNSQLLVRSSLTSCTRRETPSARMEDGVLREHRQQCMAEEHCACC